MTLDEARDHIGEGVVYTPCGCRREEGVITSVRAPYVFVQYGYEQHSTATHPAYLTLMAPAPWES